FSVELLINASRSDILLSLINLRNILSDQDNLVIYYAGHGWLDKEADEGYWLPTDAEKNNMINWISNSSITTTLRAIRAKHVLIVADSCYSGKLARGIHAVDRSPGYISRLSQKRARCVISSGGIEPVIDSGGKGLHSVFSSSFLDALAENQEIMDGIQLFNKLRRPVMLNSDQTPEYSDIRKAGHEGGEFLFVRKK
ncbi:MAG: caspase family protein, partial [Deltaproteobacteria bacterium]|nr:caspase family protein [Deltaproteobacteria bacterium]